MTLTHDIKTYAKKLGADLVGIGSTDRFEGAPLQYDPRQIMPKEKSIIDLAFRIHCGLLIALAAHLIGVPSIIPDK